MREGPKTAVDLEFSRLLDVIAQGAASDQAAERLRALLPADRPERARERMEVTAAAIEALDRGEPIPSIEVPDLSGVLERLERSGVLTVEELDAARIVMRAARDLRGHPCREVPRLGAHLSLDPSLDAPLSHLEQALDDRGALADGASPALARLRSEVGRLRRDLLDELGRLSQKHADVLREQSHVERDGRFGLPLRADAHRRVEGIVLGTSATGGTLYVEPPSVTRLSNRLKLAEAEVDREETRILAELSAALTEALALLETAYEACIEADRLAAISRFAQSQRARAIAVDERAGIELERVRHPLLVSQGVDVVPSDIALRPGEALVISGPNAGGKTVALKCLGLAVWMARAGLPLPAAEGSRIGWLSDVLTDVGDEQSIERSLSTFSAEVENLAGIVEAAHERTLILLDEVAGGTDPDEGSALAAAVLEALVDRGAAVAVTTHYERLKELPAEDDRIVNASVGFDFDAMEPTFTFTLGVPGASSALAVARRFGMPENIIQSARDRLSRQALRREELLAQLEREKRQATEAREKAEQDAAEAETLRAELESERAGIRHKERKKLEAEQSALVAKVREARAQLDQARKRLAEGRETEAERTVDEAAKLASIGGPLDPTAREARSGAAPVEMSAGDAVYVPKLGRDAVVEKVDDNQIVVRAGAFSMRLDRGDLEASKRPARTEPATPQRRKRPRRQPSGLPERAIRTDDNTCDLRGLRVEEAVERLERFVDACVMGHHDEIGFALHGHGTGALKRAVREHLSSSPRIAVCRPAQMDEGGDAFTVFRVGGL